jgi:class 3 adenylate cyclase
VTFLFSDIEASTRLLSAIGTERYERALEDHRRLLRDAFNGRAGYEVNTEGDSFFVAFSRAQDAARAALAAQRALARHAWAHSERIRVRMGVHTCEATAKEGDYVGLGVHRAARIGAAGHGDQVIVSQATRDLLEDDPAIQCDDLGSHLLKDFLQPQRLFQLVDPDLRREFPPLPPARPGKKAAGHASRTRSRLRWRARFDRGVGIVDTCPRRGPGNRIAGAPNRWSLLNQGRE